MPAVLAIGTVLGDTYRLERMLGEGGMGAVYEAAHLRLERRFAIKVLIPEVARNQAALKRFEREARVTSSLGHPHIVEVIDFNTSEDGHPYLVMERLEGESLAERLTRRVRLELPEVSSILRQATSALQAAHERQIIHRDLKPENIFLCRRGALDDYVKLLDFGLSKVLGAQSELTQVGSLLGSPSYMSPEQAEERADQVDARSDLYSLATVAFEMLTGEVPFSAQTIPSLLYKIAHEPPPSLLSARPDLSQELDDVLQIALRKRREERHATIAELWQALATCFEREAVKYVERTEIHHTAWPEAVAPEETTIPREPVPPPLQAPAESTGARPAVRSPAGQRSAPRSRAAVLGLAGGAILVGAGLGHLLLGGAPTTSARLDAGLRPSGERSRPDLTPVQPPDPGVPDAAVPPDSLRSSDRGRRLKPVPVAGVKDGWLRVGASRKLDVYLDGGKRLETPLLIKLSPGRRQVVLVDRSTGKRFTHQVVIRPGQVAAVQQRVE
jgi:serine/threonine-protein kinase